MKTTNDLFLSFDDYNKTIKAPSLLPSEYVQAVGDMALAFSTLEDQISIAIASLLGIDDESSNSVVGEMSFRAKVNLFGSLLRVRFPTTKFNTHGVPEEECIRGFISICMKAEELRNQTLHSSWLFDRDSQRAYRRKLSSKGKSGPVETVEPVDILMLNRIGNYIWYVLWCIGEFLFHFDGFKINNRTA